MTTLAIPIAAAVSAAKVVHAGTASDAVTAVLQAATWDNEAKRLVSTDRYCVVTYELPDAELALGDIELVAIPRDLLLWISRLKTRDYWGSHVRITMQDKIVVADVVDVDLVVRASSSAPRITGNFPPVMRLVEGWTPAEVAEPLGLGAEILKRVITPLVAIDKKAPIKLEPGAWASGRSAKGAPVRITQGPVVALIQPVTFVERK